MMRLITKYLKLSFLLFIFTTAAVAQDLTILSYNIRYNSQSDGEDLWDLRKEDLVSQIKKHSPDSFGVQEATEIQMQYILEALPNYVYVGVGRDDGANTGEYSAVFYLKEKFELLESNTFWLSDTPAVVSKAWDAALPRICTYAKLQERSNGKVYWHFNTHFDHIGKIARTESAKLIVNQINKIVKNGSPVIISGDFNAEPNENPIISIKNDFSDPIDSLDLEGPKGTFNGFVIGADLDRRIDYIFFRGLKALKYGHLSEKRNNGRWISDHLPVKLELNYEHFNGDIF